MPRGLSAELSAMLPSQPVTPRPIEAPPGDFSAFPGAAPKARAAKSPGPPDLSPPPLPAGWESRRAPSGALFFQNRRTGESRWDHPGTGPAPPVPAPARATADASAAPEGAPPGGAATPPMAAWARAALQLTAPVVVAPVAASPEAIRSLRLELEALQAARPDWEEFRDPTGGQILWFQRSTQQVVMHRPPEVAAWISRTAALNEEISELSRSRDRSPAGVPAGPASQAPPLQDAAAGGAVPNDAALATPAQSLARFTRASELDGAVGAWHSRLHTAVGGSTDGRVAMEATFHTRCLSQGDLHAIARAMGVHIEAAAPKGRGARPALAPPFGFATGDFHQPAVEVTWRTGPLLKLTIQLVNKRQGRIVVKGKRAAFDANLEELLMFLGPVAEIRRPKGMEPATRAAGKQGGAEAAQSQAPLREKAMRWLGAPQSRAELAAASRDFLALLHLAPAWPDGVTRHAGTVAGPLWAFAVELQHFLARALLPSLMAFPGVSRIVGGPYVGGVPQAAAAEAAGRVLGPVPPARPLFRIATLNPGRTGFLHLGTDLILEWRLEAVAHALVEHGVDVCILPGSRFPPGAWLPPGFPFVWIGPTSTEWDTVGLFVRPELEQAVRFVPEASSAREQWFEVWPSASARSPCLVLCAMYPVHGGDRDTWSSIVAHAAEFQAKYPLARLLIGGDGNVHLTYVVSHAVTCRCLHCSQRGPDRDIQALLDRANLRAFNPPKPTHSSGTCIDIFIGLRGDPLPVQVVEDFIALSDHKLVLLDAPCLVEPHLAAGFGRVAWTSGAEWEASLSEVAPTLAALAHAVELLLESQWLRPAWHGGAAERFLSGFFKDADRFDIQLVSPVTGRTQSTSEMLDAIQADLLGRAQNDFPQCPVERDRMSRVVSGIRRAGAASGPERAQPLYSETEVEEAIALLKLGKRTVHLCNAAVKAPVQEGFRLTRALLNLGRRLCVTSRFWSLRQFSPLRKSGPPVVRKVSALRPVSFASDMASVQDALWIARNGALIEAYCDLPVQEFKSSVAGILEQAAPLAASAEERLRGVFQRLPVEADRVALAEATGSFHLPPVQFVDDITTPCPSEGAVRAVISDESTSACSRYAFRMKSLFTYERDKTCVLPLLGAPIPGRPGCPVVSQKHLLGVLVDSGLTFGPLLNELCAIGDSCFKKLLFAAESGGFSVPVAAAQVPPRVEAAVLFACPLLAGVPGAEARFNKLQVGWGRRLLGCHGGPPIKHVVVVAQCGWRMRMGTRFIERALMARARLTVLPPDHPGAIMYRASRALCVPTWLSDAAALASRLPDPPPDLDSHPLFPPEALRAAQLDPARRKVLLREYRRFALRPALLRYDQQAFAAGASRVLPSLNRSFAALCPGPALPDEGMLTWEPGPSFWRYYRLWAVARMTGAWPLPVLGPGIAGSARPPRTHEFVSTISLGTPPQKLTCLVDTSVSGLWVMPASGCSGCAGRGRFEVNRSSTFSGMTSTEVRAPRYLGDDSNGPDVWGLPFEDLLGVGPMELPGQGLNLLTSAPSQAHTTKGVDWDSVCGLAWPREEEAAQLRAPSLALNMMRTGGHAVFTLAPGLGDRSYVVAGDVPQTIYKQGTLVWEELEVSNETRPFWVVPGQAQLGGERSHEARFLVDTGTSFIYVPPAVLYKDLDLGGAISSGCGLDPAAGNLLVCDCSVGQSVDAPPPRGRAVVTARKRRHRPSEAVPPPHVHSEPLPGKASAEPTDREGSTGACSQAGSRRRSSSEQLGERGWVSLPSTGDCRPRILHITLQL
ncbi:unnamed protein product [Prorocentrum cordatum]|uniref:WW domain-containing protein n=1 Tax=Prorocentrum cordatum TaxID=2364126 RepID=A0ABN9VSQ6_9DINO|nr:unnamed protein product [Polarella glacialis]